MNPPDNTAQAFPPFHPFAMGTSARQYMNNSDPANEFMYQLPPGTMRGHQVSSDINLDELNERLHGLGLHEPSTETLGQDDDSVSSASEPITPEDHLQPPFSARPSHTSQGSHITHSRAHGQHRKEPLKKLPSLQEVYPDDSISMYKPVRPPTRAASMRRGGTDMDGGEEYRDEGYTPHPEISTFSADAVTMNTPRSLAYLEPTAAPTSNWTTAFGAGGMQAMRDRLLNDQAARDADQAAELTRHIDETVQLAAALAKLEATEDQLRTLQATLIAEKVARTQIEKDAQESQESMRECRDELANAVRALRRAREEGAVGDAEKKSMRRMYEEVRIKLFKYEQELSVRDALSRGREKGRQEAWDEAAKWMGVAPPIPIDPVQQIPETVFRHTPMVGNQQLYGQYPHLNAPQGPQQQQHHHTPYGYQSPGGQQGQQGKYQPMVPSSRFQTPPDQYAQRPGQTQPTQPYPGTASQVPPSRYGSLQDHPGLQPQHPAQTQQFPHQQHQPGQMPLQPQYTGHPPKGPSPPPHMQQAQTQTPQVVGVPVGIPVSVNNQPQIPGAYPQQPYPNPAHSAPHHNSQLPQQPQRPATMVDRPRQRHSSHPPLRGPTGPPLDSAPRHNAADSFLDRVEHDPKFKHILSGAPSKTIHTSNFPPSEQSYAQDKPLPNPFLQGARAPSAKEKSRRRLSLSEGVHPSSHAMSGIPDGDRYPAFPGANGHGYGSLGHIGHKRAQSHDTGYGTINAAHYALPPSTIHTTHHTPQTRQSQPNPHSMPPSTRQTPVSQSARARSRMAAAMRNGTDIDAGELSEIEEEAEPRLSIPPPPQSERERDLMQSAVMANMNNPPPQRRRAPSMPPPRHQPRPVMPTPLGKAGSEPYMNRPPANLRRVMSVQGMQAPEHGQSFQPYEHNELAASAMNDDQAPRHSALGLEGMSQYGVPLGATRGSHGDEGGHADGHRHGENGGGDEEPRAGNGGHGNLLGMFRGSEKAPTIMIQPPSSRSKSGAPSKDPSVMPSFQDAPPPKLQMGPSADHPSRRQTTIITEYFDQTAPPPAAPFVPAPAPAPSAPAPSPPSHAQLPPKTSKAPSTQPTHVQAAQIPLPRSRAPTMQSHTPSILPHQVPLPLSRVPTAAPTAPSATAQNVSLTNPKSRAPTVYTAYTGETGQRTPKKGHKRSQSHPQPVSTYSTSTVPRGPTTTQATSGKVRSEGGERSLRTVPSVSVIDYAALPPLPDSRPTTAVDTPKAPTRPRSAGAEKSSASRRKQVDPRQVPLPASRAPTRPRASRAYARTEGTIEEVTEEESGRENGRKRW